MDVTLLSDMHKCNSDFSNWNNIQKLIPHTFNNSDLLEFSQSHESTKTKVTFADYHYFILDQFYKPKTTTRETDTDSWARAEFHSIVSNLYSALESLVYEINLAYNFGLRANQIYLNHNHKQFNSDCVRCQITAQKDNVTSQLDGNLNTAWFQIFNKLRNQIIHKNLPVIQVIVGSTTTTITIPDDPVNTNPQSTDFSRNLEINQYCKNIRKNVVEIIENIYPLIKDKIKTRFSL